MSELTPTGNHPVQEKAMYALLTALTYCRELQHHPEHTCPPPPPGLEHEDPTGSEWCSVCGAAEAAEDWTLLLRMVRDGMASYALQTPQLRRHWRDTLFPTIDALPFAPAESPDADDEPEDEGDSVL